MVALNCAAVPDSLLESELFGHVRGSFTGAYRDKPGLLELAQSGTIFLDEIGETSLRMQALMLRFLENGEIWRVGANEARTPADVRVVAATNRDLADRIAQGEFRADLYYRLNVLQIRIPPLRERREDIPLFLDHFLQAYSDRHLTPIPELTPTARARLQGYDWPGNVRELKNVIERLVVRRRSGAIRETDLPDEVLGLSASRALQATLAAGKPAHRSRVDEIYDRLVVNGESFWSAVHAPVHGTRHDARGSPRHHHQGPDPDPGQLSADAAAVQHAGRRLQAIPDVSRQASVQDAVLPVPVPAAVRAPAGGRVVIGRQVLAADSFRIGAIRMTDRTGGRRSRSDSQSGL